MEMTVENTIYEVDGKEQYKAIVHDKDIVVFGSGMTKIEFDDFILLFQTNLSLQGWKKEFSGYNSEDGVFEVHYKLKV